MSETNRTQSVEQEAAILVGVLNSDRPAAGDPLEELTGLAETAGARIVGSLTQAGCRPTSPHIWGGAKWWSSRPSPILATPT